MSSTDATGSRRVSPGSWAVWASFVLVVNVGLAWFAVNVTTGTPTLVIVLIVLFAVLAIVQLVLGSLALIGGIREGRAGAPRLVAPLLGLITALGALASLWLAAVAAAFATGGGWGRPLRVRGRQVHPALREGADWAAGERPDSSALDAATRLALEALWLHDAQKEHASVPAFSRVSWLLAAVGAPAELLEWSHRAAIEEIAHARLCFALAAGYGGRTHTVQPMPELLHAGLELEGDAVAVLMHESLGDGCQLEDFNADIAAECAQVCEEPATRAVLERIAREERSHAEFSWAVVDWLLERADVAARSALERAIAKLDAYARPTAVSWQKRRLVARADPALLRRHGRLPDERWAELWRERLELTERRVRSLLGDSRTEVGNVEMSV